MAENGTFSCVSPDQEHQQGWGGLVCQVMAGLRKGDGQAGLCRKAINSGMEKKMETSLGRVGDSVSLLIA